MTNNKTLTSRANLLRHRRLATSFGLTFSLACAFLPGAAYAANATADPDPDVEQGSYISLSLNQDIVAAGDSLSGSASIYEGDGDVDSDDSISEAPSNQSANGTVSFTVPTSSPGDVTIVASSADASSQSKVGHAVSVNAVLTPVDNFAGRSQTSYGVGENVNLSVTTTPSGYETKIGNLQWTGSGDGTTSDYGGGSGLFFAGDVAGSANIVLSVTSGALHGKSYSKSRTIVAPSGVKLVQTGGVIHTQGQATAGFHALTYFTPTNVSFHNVEEEEEYSGSEEAAGKNGPIGVGTGSLSGKNGQQHQGGGFFTAGSGDINLGCLIAVDDIEAHNQAFQPFSTSGDFTWNIPRDYKIGDNGTVHAAYTSLTHHNHQSATDATGNSVTTISKGGITVSAKQNDPNSN